MFLWQRSCLENAEGQRTLFLFWAFDLSKERSTRELLFLLLPWVSWDTIDFMTKPTKKQSNLFLGKFGLLQKGLLTYRPGPQQKRLHTPGLCQRKTGNLWLGVLSRARNRPEYQECATRIITLVECDLFLSVTTILGLYYSPKSDKISIRHRKEDKYIFSLTMQQDNNDVIIPLYTTSRKHSTIFSNSRRYRS